MTVPPCRRTSCCASRLDMPASFPTSATRCPLSSSSAAQSEVVVVIAPGSIQEERKMEYRRRLLGDRRRPVDFEPLSEHRSLCSLPNEVWGVKHADSSSRDVDGGVIGRGGTRLDILVTRE